MTDEKQRRENDSDQGHATVEREARPLIERIGLAAIAAVLAALFGGVAVASWLGGEPFLAVMGGIGSLMTLWVGVLTLIRG
jgi:asparagine N-glycosylation enzyme membrane subunit Stt3